jgi:DNA-binding winged helix-turn-helix (wHTH) protein/TolB-like protein/Tfp pilus assembly protein PilF
MSRQANHLYEFGPFRLDASERLLLRDGHPVSLTPKAFDTLLALVESSGHIVEKDDLMQKVWPDAVVEESTLAQNVFTLRKALGEGSSEHQYIETIPKHGYRFVSEVRQLPIDGASLIVERHTRSRIITEEQEQTSARDFARALLRTSPERVRSNGLRLSPTVLAVFVLLAGVAAAIIYLGKSKPKEIESTNASKVIAVLPFKPISADGRDEYLELGMADALITKLSNVSRLVVRSTNSVRKYAALEQDPVAAGRELRVDSVLEGNLQRLNDRIRVTARLVNVADGQALWTDEFDAKLTNIFVVQDSISEQITRALALKLTGEEKKLLAKRYTQNTEAYQLYQRGRYFWNKRTEEGLKKAIDYFQQAIDRDSNYALAYAGLADSYALSDLYSGGLLLRDVFPKAKAAAEKALEMDEALAEAHTSLAYVKYYYDWDWPSAEREFRRAIEINPNYATAHQWYAEYLFYMARFDESIAEIERARELDPASLVINTELGSPYFYMRQYDQAMEKYRKALEMDPSFFLGNYCVALCYGQKSMFGEAITALGGGKDVSAMVGYFYAVSGRKREAQEMLKKLMEISKRQYFSPYLIAKVHAGLGEKDQAFTWLEKAREDRDERIVMLKVDQHLDSLRSDPRFQVLLRRLGLAS